MDFNSISESANYLLNRTKHRPKIAIICGSGLGTLGDSLDAGEDAFSYSDIPHFPISTAPSHKSRLLFGKLSGVSVVLMQGRFHLYEGYSIQKMAFPVRVLKLIGVDYIIITNAAGGLNKEKLKIGDFMIVNDHINLPGFSGVNPLVGPNEKQFGPRFVDVSEMYDEDLIDIAFEAANEIGLQDNVNEGTLAMLGGPTFETPAELRMFKTCGVDAVGMSVVHEAITAHHCDIKVLAFSLITNLCKMERKNSRMNKINNNRNETNMNGHSNHEDKNVDLEAEVLDAAESRKEHLRRFMTKIVAKIHEIGDLKKSVE